MIKTYIDTNYNDNMLYIMLLCTDSCNYRCKYCCEYDRINVSNTNINFEYVKNFIKQLCNKHEKIQIDLYGGEPTLHPDLYDFCKFISTYNNIKCVIYTNFSADVSLYNNLLQLGIYIQITYHRNYDVLFKKLKLLDYNHIQQTTHIVLFNNEYYLESLKIFKQLIEYLPTIPHHIELSLIQTTNNYKAIYSNEQYDLYIKYQKYTTDKLPFYTTIDYNNNVKTELALDDLKDKVHSSFNFYHWLCSAGKKSLFIDNNGNIYPCLMYYYNNICSKYNIQNIKTDFLEKTLCKVDSCFGEVIKCENILRQNNFINNLKKSKFYIK